MHTRPQANEIADYYLPYVAYVPDDFLGYLRNSAQEIDAYMQALPEERLTYAYAEGKWSIAEVLVHIIDAERVFAYRALRIGRGDSTPLAGFHQDDYVPTSRANERSKESLIAEFETVRSATLSLYDQFNEEDLNRIGQASGYPISPRALGFIIGGHAAHHLKVLKEKY